MKRNIITRIISLTGIVFLFGCLTGCKDMFENPLKDKDSGESVTVLLIDRNFIKTTFAVRLLDIDTNEEISSEQVEISFYGSDNANLITFAGNKQTTFSTSSSFVEIGYDPNITVDAAHPIELSVVAESENYISTPQFISISAEGVKNLIIKMIKISSFKAVTLLAFGEPFDQSYNEVLHSPAGLLARYDVSRQPTGTAYSYQYMYRTLTNGTFLCNNLNDASVYSDFGAYYVNKSAGTRVIPPANPVKESSLTLNANIYTSVLKTGQLKCNSGLTIHVERPDGEPGTGVFNYLITFSDGKALEGRITCEFTSDDDFKSDNLIEPIYYPAANAAVDVVLYGDAQYNMSTTVHLDSPCGATASFNVTPKSGLKPYKFVTRYSCPDNPVGMGLSVGGEFRQAGTKDTWTSFSFIGGVCDLQLLPDADYEFRVNIDSEYYYYTLPTDSDRIKDILDQGQGESYTLKSLIITKTGTLTTIDVEVQFTSGICDLLN